MGKVLKVKTLRVFCRAWGLLFSSQISPNMGVEIMNKLSKFELRCITRKQIWGMPRGWIESSLETKMVCVGHYKIKTPIYERVV